MRQQKKTNAVMKVMAKGKKLAAKKPPRLTTGKQVMHTSKQVMHTSRARVVSAKAAGLKVQKRSTKKKKVNNKGNKRASKGQVMVKQNERAATKPKKLTTEKRVVHKGRGRAVPAKATVTKVRKENAKKKPVSKSGNGKGSKDSNNPTTIYRAKLDNAFNVVLHKYCQKFAALKVAAESSKDSKEALLGITKMYHMEGPQTPEKARKSRRQANTPEKVQKAKPCTQRSSNSPFSSHDSGMFSSSSSSWEAYFRKVKQQI